MWMVTFGDLMSLLLCFFVLLLSFSTMDPAMFKEVSGSLKQAFGVQREQIVYDLPRGVDIVSREFSPVFNTEEILEKIKSTIKLELIKGLIEIEALEDRVILRLNDDVTFEPGSAELKKTGLSVLTKLRTVVSDVPGEIMVEGHTDDIPIRSRFFSSNWKLSADRAAAVVEFFLQKNTIAPRRMAAVGYGPSRPRVANDSPEHRAKNRRVEFIILQPPRPEMFEVIPVTEKGLPDQEILPPVPF